MNTFDNQKVATWKGLRFWLKLAPPQLKFTKRPSTHRSLVGYSFALSQSKPLPPLASPLIYSSTNRTEIAGARVILYWRITAAVQTENYACILEAHSRTPYTNSVPC